MLGREGGREEAKDASTMQSLIAHMHEEGGREGGREGGKHLPVRKDGLVELPVIHILAGGEQTLRSQPGLVDVAHGVDALHARPAWREGGREGGKAR